MSRRRDKLRSIAEWDSIARRYPTGSRRDVVARLAFAVAANGLVVFYLVSGRMRPVDLVLLVALEALLLTAIAKLQSIGLDEAARFAEEKQTTGARVGVLLFGLIWLVGVYTLIFVGLLGAGGELLRAVTRPLETIRQAGLLGPLALTLAGAVLDASRDAKAFADGPPDRERKFVSTPGLNSLARWLTLFLGGIPFLIPAGALLWLLSTLLERAKKGAVGAGAGLVALPLLMAAVLFGVIAALIRAGLSGWAIGYCSAKLAGEGLLIAIPWIAAAARAEELAKL